MRFLKLEGKESLVSERELESILSIIKDWIDNSDTKVGVLLAFDGIVGVLAYKRFIDLFINTRGGSSPAEIILLIASSVLIGYSSVKALLGIFPRLNHGQNNGSLIYFYDISSITLEDYSRRIKKLTKEEYKSELVRQIYALSVVSTKKFRVFQDSLVFLFIGLSIWGVLELWLLMKN